MFIPSIEIRALSTNSKKFEGKEYMTEFGLDEYEFGARRLDPRLGHFTTPDPFATINHGISPWDYCNGDPINFIDPTGKYTLLQDKTDSKNCGSL